MNKQTDIIHIALVDDHGLFRSGIANLLSEYEDLVIEFEASNGKGTSTINAAA